MSTAASESAPPQLAEVNPPTPWWLAPIAIWQNVYKHRFLVRSFINRDLRINYRNSILGYFWSLVEPTLLTATYYVLFIVVAGEADERYPMWVIIGVLLWQFFSVSLQGAVASLTKNASMIRQVYFPREIFAVTNAGSKLTVVSLSLLISIPLMFYYGIPPTWHLLMVPVGLLLTGLLGLGIGLGCACLNAVHRDVEHFFRFFMRAGFFLSPVMWTLDQPRAIKKIEYIVLNPMAVPITMVRNGIDGRGLGDHISTGAVLYSVSFCVLAFIIGSMFFKRFESEAVKSV